MVGAPSKCEWRVRQALWRRSVEGYLSGFHTLWKELEQHVVTTAYPQNWHAAHVYSLAIFGFGLIPQSISVKHAQAKCLSVSLSLWKGRNAGVTSEKTSNIRKPFCISRDMPAAREPKIEDPTGLRLRAVALEIIQHFPVLRLSQNVGGVRSTHVEKKASIDFQLWQRETGTCEHLTQSLGGSRTTAQSVN